MTINLFITNDNWVKVVEASVESFLISWNNVNNVEFATTEGDTEPEGIVGHLLTNGNALTRQVIGDGTVWARCQDIETGEVVVLVVS